jgi:hypothetical protein
MRFPAAILACVAAAYGLGFYLAIPANPEIGFWREVVKRRESEIAEARKTQPDRAIIFFTGGSSTAFSIDPQIIENTCGMPSFNLGLPVAAGGEYLLHQALSACKPGDFLVVCLEPDLLTYSAKERSPSTFSFAMAASAGHPSEAGGGVTFDQSISIRDYLNLSRPGPRFLATLGVKMLAGKGYRYTPADIRYRGRLETLMRYPTLAPSGPAHATRLSCPGATFLQTFRRAAVNRNVRVFYSMPWQYTGENDLAENRRCKRELLKDIETIMPVLHDDFAGSISDAGYFSDTAMHLGATGSQVRSTTVAAALKLAIPPGNH